MIAYKVTGSTGCSIYAEGKYCLNYREGEITGRIPGSLGVMVFPKEEDAFNFVKHHFYNNENRYIIKKVRTIGRGEKPKLIAMSNKESGISLFYKIKNKDDREKIITVLGVLYENSKKQQEEYLETFKVLLNSSNIILK